MKTQSLTKLAATLLVAFLVTLNHGAVLADSSSMVLEGELSNLAGQPLQGPVDLRIDLLPNEGSSEAIWTEEHGNVPLVRGRFVVNLGSFDPLDPLVFELYPDLWVGLTIDGGDEIARFPVGAAGYALVSSHARSCEELTQAPDDLECEGCVSADELSFPVPAANVPGGGALSLDCVGCVKGSHLANGSVALPHLASSGCDAGDVLKRSVGGEAWICAPDENSGGDITSVEAGVGLTGGGTEGMLTLAVDPHSFQRRVANACPPGQYLRLVAEDGSVGCSPDTNTQYQAGEGLQLSGTAFSVQRGVVETWARSACYDNPLEVAVALEDFFVYKGESDSVNSTMIANGSIVSADISSTAAIPFSKLSGVAASNHGHSLADLGSGTFDSGSYYFPSDSAVFIRGFFKRDGCPTGYQTIASNLCSTDWQMQRTYHEAERMCYLQGGHICDYTEISIIWTILGGDLGLSEGDWIGGMPGDNARLCVNKVGDVSDFEGTCDKRTLHRYRCCMGLGR